MKKPTDIIPEPPSALGAVDWERLKKRQRELVEGARAPATWRAYKQGLADFADFCEQAKARFGLPDEPAIPQAIQAWLIQRADGGLSIATLRLYLVGVSLAHQQAKVPDPTKDPAVAETMKALRRERGAAGKSHGKDALVLDDVAKLVNAAYQRGGLQAVRDAAIILVGFHTSCRRSELCGFDVEDVAFTSAGAKLTIRRSKTDQEGAGRVVGIGKRGELCPVTALRAWLEDSEIETGPIFRGFWKGCGAGMDPACIRPTRLTPGAVAGILKDYAEEVGIDPKRIGGHSLRAGHVTEAYDQGVPEHKIQAQTGHRSIEMLRRYLRPKDPIASGSSAAMAGHQKDDAERALEAAFGAGKASELLAALDVQVLSVDDFAAELDSLEFTFGPVRTPGGVADGVDRSGKVFLLPAKKVRPRWLLQLAEAGLGAVFEVQAPGFSGGLRVIPKETT